MAIENLGIFRCGACDWDFLGEVPNTAATVTLKKLNLGVRISSHFLKDLKGNLKLGVILKFFRFSTEKKS